MKRLEIIIRNSLKEYFAADVHVKQVDNEIIVDMHFYYSSILFHTTIELPQEIYITPELCDDLVSQVINDFILYMNKWYL